MSGGSSTFGKRRSGVNIEGLLESIPSLSQAERTILRERARLWQASGTNEERIHADSLLNALDAHEAREAGALAERMRGLSKTERISEAFTKEPMSETERKVVQVLLDNPGTTSTELSEKLSWGSKSWHVHFGLMCQSRHSYLWPYGEKRNADFFSGILAHFDKATGGFTMKPEAVEAFARLGLNVRA